MTFVKFIGIAFGLIVVASSVGSIKTGSSSNGASENKVAAQVETFPTAQVGDRVQFTKRMCNSTLIYSVEPCKDWVQPGGTGKVYEIKKLNGSEDPELRVYLIRPDAGGAGWFSPYFTIVKTADPEPNPIRDAPHQRLDAKQAKSSDTVLTPTAPICGWRVKPEGFCTIWVNPGELGVIEHNERDAFCFRLLRETDCWWFASKDFTFIKEKPPVQSVEPAVDDRAFKFVIAVYDRGCATLPPMIVWGASLEMDDMSEALLGPAHKKVQAAIKRDGPAAFCANVKPQIDKALAKMGY